MKGMLLPVVGRMTDDVGLWRWLPRQSALSYPATPAALQKDSVRGLARDVAIPTITQHCTRVWRCSPPLPLPPPTSLNVKLFCTNLPRTELICTISSNRASQRVQSSRPTTVHRAVTWQQVTESGARAWRARDYLSRLCHAAMMLSRERGTPPALYVLQLRRG